jgi:hypothetical protein
MPKILDMGDDADMDDEYDGDDNHIAVPLTVILTSDGKIDRARNKSNVTRLSTLNRFIYLIITRYYPFSDKNQYLP